MHRCSNDKMDFYALMVYALLFLVLVVLPFKYLRLPDILREREKTLGVARSGQWSRIRKDFLQGKVCAVCGGTKDLQAHHLQSFHEHPELELDPRNLLAVCEGNHNINCHLVVGH